MHMKFLFMSGSESDTVFFFNISYIIYVYICLDLLFPQFEIIFVIVS